MAFLSVLPIVAAVLALGLGCGGLARKRPSVATWCFFVGMAVLATESLFNGLAFWHLERAEILRWLTLGLVAKSFVPATWLAFSLTYSRGDYRESLSGWRTALGVLAVAPVVVSLGLRDQLLGLDEVGRSGSGFFLHFGVAGTLLNVVVLVSLVLIVTNLEHTFRSAVGTMRWRIKFVVIGLAVIFGGHFYVRSEAILFSSHDLVLSAVESSALLTGCGFLALAYARGGLAEVEVYPSRAVLRSSITVVLAGGYLSVVGILAQVVRRFGGAESFQVQVFVVLLGMAGLATLLLSDRLRQRIQEFVSRHFGKAQHDSARIWSELSKQLAGVQDEKTLASTATRFVSEILAVLSASAWLLDDSSGQLTLVASTSASPRPDGENRPSIDALKVMVPALTKRRSAFNLEQERAPWAERLRALNLSQFPNGGERWCVPLRSNDRLLGLLILADRVSGREYTLEEQELLQCASDQLASVLANLRLSSEVARNRELEAFRTMSAFFVHDLKNAAASLNLMLKNLPVHFDDAAYRKDALHAVGNSAKRIEGMIARLAALRKRPEFNPIDVDLVSVVRSSLLALGDTTGIEVRPQLKPLPTVNGDPPQLESVVTNLLLNAREAVQSASHGNAGWIDVRTEAAGDKAVVSVGDNGCGMSHAFVRDSLFRPFQSTKQNGLGIGMFQSRTIVEAHHGSIHVESEPGKGTTIRVVLPTKSE